MAQVEQSVLYVYVCGLSSLDETYIEYLLAPTDDLIRFWRSKVRVTTDLRGQILWTPYLLNYLSSFDETYAE